MRPLLGCLVALCMLISAGFVSAPGDQALEKRIALVIGNAAYQTGALPTSANDAGLVAQTLQAAGFDVVGARDLDEESLRRAFREFLDKASGSGPDTVAFIYLSGYGLQLEGDNYFVPIDARAGRGANVPAQALRISDYIRPLETFGLKASIVVLDLARRTPFAASGDAIAGGLALGAPGPGMLVAFNAAPGTVAPDQAGPYGAYAQALAEMMRDGGLSLDDLFERVRLRVSERTKGAQIPWDASRVKAPFAFFERSPDAPPAIAGNGDDASRRSRPIAELAASEAYWAALRRDTLEGYEEFLATFSDDPMARRVRAIVAARREAITWRETCLTDTPEAYWSYLRRYPHGPHDGDARRRLALRAVAFEPPASFAQIDYDVPPPPPEEEIIIERPVLAFDDPELGFAPLPPAPIYFLPPPPPEFIVLDAPLPPIELFVLPVPVFVPIPLWCHPPHYVVPPPDNLIFKNSHNAVVINQAGRLATIKDHHGSGHDATGHGDNVHLALAPALPRSIANRLNVTTAHSPASDMRATGSTPRPPKVPLGQPLPGRQGQPLPPFASSGRGPTTPSPLSALAHGGAISRQPDMPHDTRARPSAMTTPPRAAALPRIAVTPPPPVQAPRPPAIAMPRTFGAPLPPQIARPMSAPPPVYRPALPPPVYRPAPAPSAVHAAPAPMQAPRPAPAMPAPRTFGAPLPPQIARPMSPPPPVYRPALPPPIIHAAPAPVVRAAPALPPPVRVAPPPVARAPVAPAQMRAGPPPVAHAPMAPGRKG